MATNSFERFYKVTWYTNSIGEKVSLLRKDIPFQIAGGKIELGEIPDYINKIQIPNMYEKDINSTLTSSNMFKCDYNEGTIYLDPSIDGQFVNITFYAKGKIKYRSANVMVETDKYSADNVEDAFIETADRINNLIISNPQPAEIQDARVDSVYGVTDITLKQGLDRRTNIIKKSSDDIGDISKLNTLDKNNMVNAINEIKSTKVDTNDYIKSRGYVNDTGSANSYVITLTPAPTSYIVGQVFYFKASNSNNSVSTLNVNGLGVKTIKKDVNVDLVSGDILEGQIVNCVYDGTNFQLVNPDYALQFNNKANKDSATMTNLTATGFLNGSYTKKTDGNGAGLFFIDNSLIILYAVDQGTPANYIFAMGYKAIGTSPVLSVIKNNVLALGASNSQGTQVITGGTAEYITAYAISIPR